MHAECRSLRRGSSLAILVGSLVWAAPSFANLITNGGFETPVVAPGGFQVALTGSTFSGWTVVGAPGAVSVLSGSFTQSGFTFPAQQGAQWLDLATAPGNTPTGVEQSVVTIPGTVYDLSFWVGNMVNAGGVFGTTSTVEVFVDGLSRGTFTNNLGAGNSLQWQQFGLSFTAVGAMTSVRFLNRDVPSDNVNGLDNIVLVAPSQQVPEPPAIHLLGLALAAVPLARARRRRA